MVQYNSSRIQIHNVILEFEKQNGNLVITAYFKLASKLESFNSKWNFPKEIFQFDAFKY